MKSVLSEKIKKAGSVLLIPTCMIIPNSNQPRKTFDNQKLRELAESIKHNGIIQPLVVRIKDEKFELISGERRLRAAESLNLETVPCIVMSVSDEKSALFSVIENAQREKLVFRDEAEAIYNLCNNFGMKQSEITDKLGKTSLYLSSKLEFMEFSDEIKDIIIENGLNERYILSLCKMKSDADRKKFIEYVIGKTPELTDETEYKDQNKNKPIIRFNKLNNIRIFVNTLNHTVETMRSAGINAIATESENSDYLEYVVRIPKKTSSPVRLVDLSCNVV